MSLFEYLTSASWIESMIKLPIWEPVVVAALMACIVGLVLRILGR